MTTDAAPERVPPAETGSAQRDRGEILRVLGRLVDDRTPVQIDLERDGAVIHSRVLGLSGDARSVFLEWDAEAGERLVRAGVATCHAAIGHDRVHFAIDPKVGEYQRTRAVRAKVPDVVVKVQRREYYRTRIAPDDGVTCTLDLPRPGGAPQSTEVAVVDLSATGMAFRVPLAVGAQLRLQAELGGCVVALPDVGAVRPAVVVRGMRKVDEGGAVGVRVGCEFAGLRRDEVALVQRFITRVERRRREEARAGSGR